MRLQQIESCTRGSSSDEALTPSQHKHLVDARRALSYARNLQSQIEESKQRSLAELAAQVLVENHGGHRRAYFKVVAEFVAAPSAQAVLNQSSQHMLKLRQRVELLRSNDDRKHHSIYSKERRLANELDNLKRLLSEHDDANRRLDLEIKQV